MMWKMSHTWRYRAGVAMIRQVLLVRQRELISLGGRHSRVEDPSSPIRCWSKFMMIECAVETLHPRGYLWSLGSHSQARKS